MSPEQFAKRLDARKTAGGWQAKCPAHEDKHASLSIAIGTKGALLTCHAGCEWGDVLAAMGVEPSELFAEERTGKPRVVAEYDYRDAAGKLCYQVLRYEPKTFRQRRPADGGWVWNLKGVTSLLYRTERLAKLEPGSRVYLVEGEKDADALWAINLPATTNSGGASKWSPALTAQLAPYDVVALPDNDKPGQAHAEGVCEKLRAQGSSARLVELPGLPEKGDVSDWLANGGTKAELESLSRGQVPGFESFSDRLDEASEQRKKHIKRIIPFNIGYLDDCLLGIHPTDLIIISAATGAGKTTLGSLLAQRAAADGRTVHFFALEAFRAEIETRQLYRAVCTAASKAGKFKPWMALNKWVYGKCPQLDPFEEPAKDLIRDEMRTLHTFYRESRFNKDDVTRLFLAAKGTTDLIILDHLHYVDTDGPNENAEVKRIVQAIRDATLAMQVPVIVIAHLRKKQGGNTRREMPDMDDIHGSSDITKIATKVLMVAPARSEGFGSNEPGIANTFMQVAKDRYAGASGYAALLKYDLSSMSYQDRYRVCRVRPDGSVEPAKKLPPWASSARATI